MHCKHCGNQIENDSKFCSFCGGKIDLSFNTTQKSFIQNETETFFTPINEKSMNEKISNSQDIVSPKTVQKLEGIFGVNISKQIIGYYLVWFLLNLILFLITWNASDYANERFWPFSERSSLKHYDFSEFLLFTLVPLIILVIINLFKDSKETMADKYDLSYEKDTRPTIIGVILVIISIVFYFVIGNNDDDYVVGASFISLIIRIFTSTSVVDIAKSLNRNTTSWGFFAFFFPSISLIIIGQKRKLKTQ